MGTWLKHLLRVKASASSLIKCFDVKQRFNMKPTQLNTTQHSCVELREMKDRCPRPSGAWPALEEIMLTNRQMTDRGYSKAFRCCFDLLAKYADGNGGANMWRQCAEDAAGVYDQFSDQPFAPMVLKMLRSVFEEIERLHDPRTECLKQSEQKGEYRFTL